uniref:ATP sulfurylase n=1 Tax=Arundo donax TaxID=35708 RepID=A0A0A8XYR3_ARUDO
MSLRTARGRSRSSTSATRVAPSAWMTRRWASPTASTMGTDMLTIPPFSPRMALK